MPRGGYHSGPTPVRASPPYGCGPRPGRCDSPAPASRVHGPARANGGRRRCRSRGAVSFPRMQTRLLWASVQGRHRGRPGAPSRTAEHRHAAMPRTASADRGPLRPGRADDVSGPAVGRCAPTGRQPARPELAPRCPPRFKSEDRSPNRRAGGSGPVLQYTATPALPDARQSAAAGCTPSPPPARCGC